MYESSVSDPGRIAAQVVSWVWFLGAGAIMKMWLNTKWLTTAANIWVTAAIWLAVGAGLYIIAVFAALLILFNLIFISRIKGRFIKKKRYCSIHLEFSKIPEIELSILEKLKELQIKTITKNIKEDKHHIYVRIIAKINKNLDVYEVHRQFKKIHWLKKVSVAENVK
jgi:putative Mg2+ transporter-C (MgtC) family protein